MKATLSPPVLAFRRQTLGAPHGRLETPPAFLLRLTGLARDGCAYERPLRNPRNRQDRLGRRDSQRLPKAGQEAAPGSQSGRQAVGGAVQGGQRRQRSAFRPGEAAALRRRRDRRLGGGEGAAERPLLSRLRRRGRPPLRGPMRLTGTSRRATICSRSSCAAAPSRRGAGRARTCITSFRSISSTR